HCASHERSGSPSPSPQECSNRSSPDRPRAAPVDTSPPDAPPPSPAYAHEKTPGSVPAAQTGATSHHQTSQRTTSHSYAPYDRNATDTPRSEPSAQAQPYRISISVCAIKTNISSNIS